jgi:hypothetical protein
MDTGAAQPGIDQTYFRQRCLSLSTPIYAAVIIIIIIIIIKLALASLTSGGRSVGIVRLRTTSHGVFLFLYLMTVNKQEVLGRANRLLSFDTTWTA